MTFEELEISDKIKKALKDMNYDTPSPIQAEAIPVLLQGRDVLGCAQTGTGKTCAFMVPIINFILNNNSLRGIKALILTPTRELAIQIYENTQAYSKYTKIKSLAIFGGVKEGLQKEKLKNGVDILIATPGRLLDFIGQGVLNIRQISFFVLDEADRMLDMGFIHDVNRIVSLVPSQRQTLLFSATMPSSIKELCNKLLNNPVNISVTPPSTTVEAIKQSVYFVDKTNKTNLLIDILKNNSIFSALIFCRTKHGADKINKDLVKASLSSNAIHGNKSQNARQRALQDFKDNKIQALVATDIAARGIDIDYLSHVINYDLPDVSETYVHRIGRTARAGRSGESLTFCSYDEMDMLRQIERDCKIKIDVIENVKYEMKNLTKSEPKAKPQRPSRRLNSSSFNEPKKKKVSNTSHDYHKSGSQAARRNK